MRIFDPHIHMTSRTTDDYEAMYAAGVRALVEPAFWLGQPRTSVGVVHRLLRRADRLGAVPRRAVRHPPPLHDRAQPQGGQRPAAAREVLDVLPRYLAKDGVVAVGEVGYDSMTPEEDEAFAAPAASWPLDHDLPVAGAHPAPGQARRHPAHPRRGRASPASTPGRVLVDHLNEMTVAAGRRTPAAGWGSPSTRTPRWTSSGWSRILQRATAPSGCWSTPPPTGAAATR